MTTVNLPDELVRRAIDTTGASSADEAVAKVLDQLTVRPGQGSQKELIKYLGTFENFMTPQELDEMRSME